MTTTLEQTGECTVNDRDTQAYQVLLYYKYVKIDNPEEFAKDHLEFCKAVGLRGQILVAHEGINGTVSGTVSQTGQYMMHMHADPRFRDMEFKIEPPTDMYLSACLCGPGRKLSILDSKTISTRIS